MKKNRTAAYACLVSFLATLLCGCSKLPPTSEEYPLFKGSVWTYSGTVKWEEAQQERSKPITWRVEVIEEVKRRGIQGYRLKGDLLDLAFYAQETRPSEYAIVRIGPNRYYKTSLAVLQRIKDDKDDLVNLVKDSEIIFDFPLVVGKKFCESEQIARDDDLYCWVVSQGPVLTYRTLPDHQTLHFQSGVGISEYEYVHHGTVSEVYLKLQERQGI